MKITKKDRKALAKALREAAQRREQGERVNMWDWYGTCIQVSRACSGVFGNAENWYDNSLAVPLAYAAWFKPKWRSEYDMWWGANDDPDTAANNQRILALLFFADIVEGGDE